MDRLTAAPPDLTQTDPPKSHSQVIQGESRAGEIDSELTAAEQAHLSTPSAASSQDTVESLPLSSWGGVGSREIYFHHCNSLLSKERKRPPTMGRPVLAGEKDKLRNVSSCQDRCVHS